MPAATLRPAADADADLLIALVGTCYAEHPGCVLDLDGVDADLRAVASHLEPVGGRMWLAEDRRGAVACVGFAPTRVHGAPAVELKRLYVRPDARRRGLGRRLVAHVEAVAARRGDEVVELWSDSRFTDAHRLYTSLGYVRQPETRQLHDPSNTTEHHFVKQLVAGAGSPTGPPRRGRHARQ